MVIKVSSDGNIETYKYERSQLKELVGDWYEIVKPVRLYKDWGFNLNPSTVVPIMLVDESALLKVASKYNPIASWLYGADMHGNPIFGDVVFVGTISTNDGIDICDLGVELTQKLLLRIKHLKDKEIRT